MDNQPQQRFCTNCGQPLAPGAAFCVACGMQASTPQPQLRARRPGARLRGCGCFLLVLAALAAPFLGVALTSGRPHQIFTYVAAGMVVFFFLLLLIGMLATRRGREALSEGCLEAILGGFLGGG